MASMAYKTTMFMVFFNYSMMIANYIGTLIFRDGSPHVGTASITVLQGSGVFTSFSSINSILSMVMTAGMLALFAFSLLVPTIPFIYLFFGLNSAITAVYISQFIPPCSPAVGNVATTCMPFLGSTMSIFAVPLTFGVLIIYYIGMSEYAGRTKV